MFSTNDLEISLLVTFELNGVVKSENEQVSVSCSGGDMISSQAMKQ